MQNLTTLLEYFASTVLWAFLNPYGFRQMLLQTGGQLVAILRGLVKGIGQTDERLSLRLPFDGRWKVVNGGVKRENSHSWDLISQRYAYDFFIVDENGQPYSGDPSRPQDYYAFGQPILAAADGQVVKIREGIRDFGRAGRGWVDWQAADIRGNFVVIRHQPNRYTLYAHLQAGSVSVQQGEHVRAGQQISRCGHSGHSTAPHLHFQLQDGPDFHTAIGLPIRFQNFERTRPGLGADIVQQGTTTSGDLVNHAGESDRQGVVEEVKLQPPTLVDLVKSIIFVFLTGLGIYAILSELFGLLIRLLT